MLSIYPQNDLRLVKDCTVSICYYEFDLFNGVMSVQVLVSSLFTHLKHTVDGFMFKLHQVPCVPYVLQKFWFDLCKFGQRKCTFPDLASRCWDVPMSGCQIKTQNSVFVILCGLVKFRWVFAVENTSAYSPSSATTAFFFTFLIYCFVLLPLKKTKLFSVTGSCFLAV